MSNVKKEEYEGKIRQLEHDLESRLEYVRHLEGLLDRVNESVGDCACMVDLEVLRPFSIERGFRNNYEQTIYGYYHGNDVKVWCFSCSRERHEVLAKEFEAFLQRNKGKKRERCF